MSSSKASSPNWLIRLAVLAGVLLVVYFAVSYAIRPVAMVVAVTRGSSVRVVPGTVEVKAEFDSELKSAAGGRVKSSQLEIGKRVYKNDVLVQIDTADVDIDIERFKNEIVAAKKKVEVGPTSRADVLNQKDELDAYERQMKAGSYPAGEFAKKQRSYQQAVQKMELEESNDKLLLANWENSLKAKELEKSKMTITAPTDGTITAVLARVGDLIDRNQAIANFIAVNRTVEGKLSEENFAAVKLGQKVSVRFLTYGKDQYNATISKVLPSADPTTQRYSIFLDVALPEGRVLTPGITGEMTVIVAQRENALIIPRRALVGEYVYVLDGTKLVLRKVVKGYEGTNFVEIMTGVKDGEMVVVEQQDTLREGERVRTKILAE
jgi:RND family efflux transporter MFP subunit